MTIDMPVTSCSTHQGIMKKVESENDIVDTPNEYYLQIYSKDRDLIESWLKLETVAKYVESTLSLDVHQLSEE